MSDSDLTNSRTFTLLEWYGAPGRRWLKAEEDLRNKSNRNKGRVLADLGKAGRMSGTLRGSLCAKHRMSPSSTTTSPFSFVDFPSTLAAFDFASACRDPGPDSFSVRAILRTWYELSSVACNLTSRPAVPTPQTCIAVLSPEINLQLRESQHVG